MHEPPSRTIPPTTSVDRVAEGAGRLFPPLDSRPPRWALDAVDGEVIEAATARAAASSGPLLLHASIANLTELPGDLARARVGEAFTLIRSALLATGRQPIRFWNFVPDLDAIVAPGLDRYMVFNAGRHDAFVGGLPSAPPAATASAVGVAGHTLDLFCLATPEGGRAVENPRQKSAWLYSTRYGPLPPFFARATIAAVNGRTRLLIGGTASIVGEDSTHPRSIGGQLEETLANLAAVVQSGVVESEPPEQSLGRLREIRAYIRHQEDGEIVADALAACSPDARIEVTRACICRPELLVEIEAVADLTG